MGGCAGEGVRRWRLAALTMTPARAAHTSGLRRTSPVAAVASFRSAAARIVFTEERSSVMCKLSLSRACVWDTLSLLVVTSETGDPCGHLCVVAAGRFFAPLRIFACWAASCAHSRMCGRRGGGGAFSSVFVEGREAVEGIQLDGADQRSVARSLSDLCGKDVTYNIGETRYTALQAEPRNTCCARTLPGLSSLPTTTTKVTRALLTQRHRHASTALNPAHLRCYARAAPERPAQKRSRRRAQ